MVVLKTVMISTDAEGKAPAREMTGFCDTDSDGFRDPGEPFTLTDNQGVFSFYNLIPGQKYRVGVDLPGGAKFRAAGAGADLSNPVRDVTVGQDVNPETGAQSH